MMIPFLLFFILISIFINSTDRPFNIKRVRPDVVVLDLFATDQEEAERWGCFAEDIPRSVQQQFEIGTTVLIDVGNQCDGVYIVIPLLEDVDPERMSTGLAFMKLKHTSPGEVYKFQRGTFRGRTVEIEQSISDGESIVSKFGDPKWSPPCRIQVGQGPIVFMLSQLQIDEHITHKHLYRIPQIVVQPKSILLINDVPSGCADKTDFTTISIDVKPWMFYSWLELRVINLSSTSIIEFDGCNCPIIPVKTEQTVFICSGNIFCSTSISMT
jgi:hypothetical protein